MKHSIFLVLTFALIACNSSGGGSSNKAAEVAPTPQPDPVVHESIFQVWTPDDSTAMELDFSSFQFDAVDSFHLAGCNIDTEFEDQVDTDDYDFIVMKFSSSTWDGVTGASDPGCNDFNGTYMMAIEQNKMEMCVPPTWDTCYYYTKE